MDVSLVPLSSQEIEYEHNKWFNCDFGQVKTHVLRAGHLRDLCLKKLRALATPKDANAALTAMATPVSHSKKSVQMSLDPASQNTDDVFIPLKPRDLPMYDPVYLEAKQLHLLHSGQYTYLVRPVPEASKRFMLLCYLHDQKPISALIEKWNGSLRVILVALERMPKKWFAGTLFHGFVKNGEFRIYNIAAYNDLCTSEENSLIRFHQAQVAYHDYLASPCVMKDEEGAGHAMKISISPRSQYPDMPILSEDEMKNWKPRAFWFIPDVDELQVTVQDGNSGSDGGAHGGTAAAINKKQETKVKLHGQNPLIFEVPVSKSDFHICATYSIEPVPRAEQNLTRLPIMGQIMSELQDPSLFHIKLHLRAQNDTKSAYGECVGIVPARNPKECDLTSHLIEKWSDQQVLHQLYCLEIGGHEMKSSKAKFFQKAQSVTCKTSGAMVIFAPKQDSDSCCWRAGIFQTDDVESRTSLEYAHKMYNAFKNDSLIHYSWLMAILANVDTVQRTDQLDQDFLKLADASKQYILQATGWLAE